MNIRKQIKVLLIGPLPRDIGGSYTTGVCKVVYELSKHTSSDVIYHVSASNLSNKVAKKISSFPNQYNGYRWLLCEIIKDFLFHPIRTFKELMYYKNVLNTNPLKWELYKVNIRNDINKIKPDIIHIHQSISAAFFANLKRIPSIVTMHGIFYRGLPEQEQLKGMAWANVTQADYYTGLTKECEYYMKTLFQIPEDKMRIIPNGTNSELYRYDDSQRMEIREQLEVGENDIVFITVASLQERKGQLRFIKFLENLNINYQYWLLGSGPDRQLIDRYIDEKDLSHCIKCLGNINSEDLYKYYSAADIYAHVSTMEGQALCEMEAYSTGIRTIVNKDVVDTVTTGVSNRNIYYILDFNYPLYDDIKEWISKGNPNRKSRKDADWQLIADKYAQFYKHILNKK